ncbi:unnamed protein product [Orchesella dallaii]|uniref:Uncharacterized protein n=1 Tax=Orchesella dallaii TaxID=48710 RepID=A0ABP1PSS9_9HEXA
MGVSELLHFRRMLRRGRKVADGSRNFVVGVEKTQHERHSRPNFVVHYDSSDLSSAELDTCNNNSIQNSATVTNTTPPSPTTASVIISTVFPGAEPVSGSTTRNDRNVTNNGPAVLRAMELEEVQLFSQSSREELMTDE